jgi:hypothetical protein
VKEKPNIFVDLDETLISSIYGKGRNPGKRKVIDLTADDGQREPYHSFLRPSAHKLLERLRAYGNVRILTTATRDYALAHNEAFQLGFTPEEIIAREDYTIEIRGAYGSNETHLINEGQFPGALLIDDLTPEDRPLQLKLRWLGPGALHVPIQAFNGKDHPNFEIKLEKLWGTIDKWWGQKEAGPKTPAPKEHNNTEPEPDHPCL